MATRIVNTYRANLLKEMPFYRLTDFQMIWENDTCRQNILNKMENNGFIEFFKNSNDYVDNKAFLDKHKYYDTDELNQAMNIPELIKLIHINARMLSKNRGKILGFLKTLNVQPDIILLSEIGKEGFRYLSNTFPNYDAEYDIPLDNKYGGVAILIDKSNIKVTVKDELRFIKECNCSKCQFENKWVELEINKKCYIIGCIYRHPNGNVDHFIQVLSKSIDKLPKNLTCIIGGDLNINLIDIQNEGVLSFTTELMSNGFFPNIYLPTRITDKSCTLIDHFFLLEHPTVTKLT